MKENTFQISRYTQNYYNNEKITNTPKYCNT